MVNNSLIKRKTFLDVAKGLGIILVVLGHCPQVFNPLKQWIYAFHMPLFFIISGLVWNKDSHKRKGFFNRSFFVLKIYRLIVPCFIWGALYMIANAIIHQSFTVRKIAYLIYGSQAGFSLAGSLTSLWFLPCMFITVCLFELLQQLLASNRHSILILFGTSVLCTAIGFFLPRFGGGYPWSIDVAFLALAMMLWGYFCQDYLGIIINRRWISIIICIVCFAITFTYRFNLSFISINNADMAGRFFGNPILYLIAAIGGSFMIILLSDFISNCSGMSKTLSCFGKHTIPILIIHKPIVQILGVERRILSGTGDRDFEDIAA